MRRAGRGFTLVEVLLAILIGSLLLTTIYGIFTSVSNARNRLEVEGEAYHQVRIFFDRIGGELRSLRSVTVGGMTVFETGHTLDGDLYFEFNTELVSPLMKQHGGLSRVRYEVRNDDQTETSSIFRSEQVLLADLAASEALPFLSGVKNFQLRYFDNGSWSVQWSKNMPPKLMEISFELELEGSLVPFRTSFVLLGS